MTPGRLVLQVVLEFSRRGCAYCAKQLPVLQDSRVRVKREGVVCFFPLNGKGWEMMVKIVCYKRLRFTHHPIRHYLHPLKPGENKQNCTWTKTRCDSITSFNFTSHWFFFWPTNSHHFMSHNSDRYITRSPAACQTWNVTTGGTVDGRNPAPPGMHNNPVNNGISYQPQRVNAGFLNHQQYCCTFWVHIYILASSWQSHA